MTTFQTTILSALALCFALNAEAQNNRMISRETIEIYAGTDAYMAAVPLEIPAKHQGASAVALGNIWVENIEDKGSKLLRIAHQRLLIKLQDKAAVDDFSTFDLDSRSVRVFGMLDMKRYALTIRKTDGTLEQVFLEKLEKNADGKVAIPNLSVGDILDFGMRTEETLIGDGCFKMSISTLSETFPCLYGYQRFELGRGFFVNFKGLNGAPDLKLNNELSSRTNLVYELKYAEMPPSNKEIWAPEYRTDPTFKMQVCYYPVRDANQKGAFLGEPATVKTSVPDAERETRLKIVYKNYFFLTRDERTAYFDKWFQKNYPTGIKSNEAYMNVAYYHYRYFTLIFDPIGGYFKKDYNSRYVNNDYFLKVMIQAAQNRGIPVELVFSNNKYWGDWDEVVTFYEVGAILRFKADDGSWMYMENPTAFQTSDYFNYRFQGQEGFAYDGKKFQKITVPIIPASKNLNSAICKVNLDLDTRKASLDLRSSCNAIFKTNISYAVLDETEYHNDAAAAMLPAGQPDAMFEKRGAARMQARAEEVMKKDSSVKLDKMKKLRSEDFDVDTYESFELISSGVQSEYDSLIYTEQFTIKDVIEKVGPNYVINLKRIVFDQVSFTDEEKASRKADVFINYPKSYNYEYLITIPEGYTAAGLEALNKEYDSEYGRVKFSASQAGNLIYLNLEKVYKEIFIPKENWIKLMAFLDPASRINDAKIVLKSK